MKRKGKTFILAGLGLLAVFAAWTILVKYVDVAAIGPEASRVGFSKMNGFVHTLTGTHMWLYMVTDWLGLVPIGTAFGFAMLGLVQWIKRKKLFKVDPDIFVLGGFYIAVMAVYVLFEFAVINYRPILIEGRLEASYPSSTTMLVMCVMPTAFLQLRQRLKNKPAWRCISLIICVFTVFMVAGRLISGVHWITDIIGGAWFSLGMVALYCGVTEMLNE